MERGSRRVGIAEWIRDERVRTATQAAMRSVGLSSNHRRAHNPGVSPAVGPKEKLSLRKRLFPPNNEPWWHRGLQPTSEHREAITQMAATLPHCGDGRTEAVLAHAQEIAQTAVDRAAAADRRATTIAGTVAIAASLTLSGASLVFDDDKIKDDVWRGVLAFILFAATAAFVIAAVYALVALVRHRKWTWAEMWDLPTQAVSGEELNRNRAAYLLHNFRWNWEISDVKNRCVDNALRSLIVALVLLALLALALFIYALT
jgi:hypothetical protein